LLPGDKQKRTKPGRKMNSTTAVPISRTGPYPELTGYALVVGYMLGALISLSIGYAALVAFT